MVRLQTVLDSWRTVRKDTIQAVIDLPDGDVGFRPVPDLMTFGEIARHILDAGHALTGLLLNGEENLASPEFRAKVQQLAAELPAGVDVGTLTAALESSLEQRVAQFAEQPPEFYEHIITRFDGQPVTRLEMLQFVKEHELTHRSQLFMYLRLKGVVPVTTRRRQAKK
jgi:uncharacterized damage-inducible protein DinB